MTAPSDVDLPPLKRDRRLLGWALGHGVSEVGDQIFYVALAYTAAQVAGPGIAGAIMAFAIAPRAVVSLFAGALVDRLDPRRVMIVSFAVQAAILLLAVGVLSVTAASAWLLIAVAIPFGVASAFDQPAAFTLPRQLRQPEELTQVAGLRQLIGRGAAIGGPPLGGVIVVAFGLAGALLVDALTFLVIVGVLLMTRPRWPLKRSGGESLVAAVKGGLSYIAANPQVRGLMLAITGLNVLPTPVIAVGLALRTTNEEWGAVALGFLMGVIGGGAAIGTIIVMFFKPQRPVFASLLFLLVQGVAIGIVGFAPYPVVLAAMTVLGLMAGLASPLLAGTFQAMIDEKYVARASALINMVDDALVPLSLVAFGALAGLTSLTVACAVFGLGVLIVLGYSLSRSHVRAM